MSDASFYTVEQNAFSLVNNQPMQFRLTYERVFVPAHSVWRDFLVHSEEIGPAVRTELAQLAA
jgi:hypothetical protein